MQRSLPDALNKMANHKMEFSKVINRGKSCRLQRATIETPEDHSTELYKELAEVLCQTPATPVQADFSILNQNYVTKEEYDLSLSNTAIDITKVAPAISTQIAQSLQSRTSQHKSESEAKYPAGRWLKVKLRPYLPIELLNS